jgi:Response regulator containing CheY-like receiver domain and AraC-type DNA-binding domain
MPKRLLFVDDEILVLNGLRRALHGMRQDWDMRFVEGAQAALLALDQQVYDAIITDMRMPVMDGAQLLELVKERYPNVVRIILSGQSSREAVFRSISPAHQFLSKPCDPQELVTRLGHAFAMQDLLANQSLKTVVFALAIDSKPPHALPRTDGGAPAGRSFPGSNRTHHCERCRHGNQDSPAVKFRLHRRARSSIKSVAGRVFDRHRDRAHAGAFLSRLFRSVKTAQLLATCRLCGSTA